MTVRFHSRFFASTFQFWFDFCMYLFQGTLSVLLYCKIRIQNSLKCAFLIDEQRLLQFEHHFVLPENFQIRKTLCVPLFVWQVLKHGDEGLSDCKSSCSCYYFQIEGLGLHVYITHYVIRIKKHVHNQIKIIEIKSQGIWIIYPYLAQLNKQYHRKVLLSSFHLTGHNYLGFHPQTQ